MYLLDVAPLWVPFAFLGAGVFLIGAFAALMIFLAIKLIKKTISKNREE